MLRCFVLGLRFSQRAVNEELVLWDMASSQCLREIVVSSSVVSNSVTRVLSPEDGRTTLLRNVSNYLTNRQGATSHKVASPSFVEQL